MAGQTGADNPALAAVWTDGKIHTGEGLQQVLPGVGVAWGIVLPVLWFSHGSWSLEAEEGPGLLQFGFGIVGSHEAVVANFDEPGRENVPEKAADELRGGEGHQPFVPGTVIVSGLEGDLPRRQAHQPAQTNAPKLPSLPDFNPRGRDSHSSSSGWPECCCIISAGMNLTNFLGM
jgi:hypothetical protein